MVRQGGVGLGQVWWGKARYGFIKYHGKYKNTKFNAVWRGEARYGEVWSGKAG